MSISIITVTTRETEGILNKTKNYVLRKGHEHQGKLRSWKTALAAGAVSAAVPVAAPAIIPAAVAGAVVSKVGSMKHNSNADQFNKKNCAHAIIDNDSRKQWSATDRSNCNDAYEQHVWNTAYEKGTVDNRADLDAAYQWRCSNQGKVKEYKAFCDTYVPHPMNQAAMEQAAARTQQRAIQKGMSIEQQQKMVAAQQRAMTQPPKPAPAPKKKSSSEPLLSGTNTRKLNDALDVANFLLKF